MPGSMCSPAPVLDSLICCMYVRPNMLMSPIASPRLGIGPLIRVKTSVSSVMVQLEKPVLAGRVMRAARWR